MTENDLTNRAIELANRPYTLFVFLDETTDGDTIHVALNPDLPGCVAQGDTAAEAESILAEVRADYIAHLLAHNLPIPEPGLIRQPADRSGLLSAARPADSNSPTWRLVEPAPDDTFRPSAQLVIYT